MFDTNMKISPVEIWSPVNKRIWYLKQGSLWKDISETGLIGESGWGKQTLTDLHWKLKIGTICCCLKKKTRLRRSRHWIEDEGGGGSWKYLIMNLLFCVLDKNYCFGETLLSCRRMIMTFNLLQNTFDGQQCNGGLGVNMLALQQGNRRLWCASTDSQQKTKNCTRQKR